MHTFYLLLSLWASFTTPAILPPSGPDVRALSCAAEELHHVLAGTDRSYAGRQETLDEAWARSRATTPAAKVVAPPPFVIPVVFHIVHQNGTENISDGDIIRSLDFLNQSFANTNYFDQGTGVATSIQFCLAERTPDNQVTSGITRTASPLTDLNTDDDVQLKNLSRWAPREYLNIWVVKEICGLGLGCGVAGYAYYPGAHGSAVDGIVVEARHLTSTEARATVLTHEAGHYLGLRHTFNGGCVNDDCTRDGDGICDTPPDQSKVAVPCSGTVNTCSTDTDSGFATDQNDMFINYMDYGYWSCYSAFTAGQRDRMQFTLEGTRRSLTESKGCLPPCPALVTAAFTGGDVTVEPGSTVNFSNTSSNGSLYSWRENQTTFSTAQNASRTFNLEGVYRIRLVAASSNNLCSPDSTEQVVTVRCSVAASFDLPGQTVFVDSLVRFVNTSVNGNASDWTINGAPAGTSADLEHTFTAPGVYTVCLQETNGACAREFCRVIFARTPPCTSDCPDTVPCTAPFAFLYHHPGGVSQGSNTFSTVLPLNDGFILAGHPTTSAAPFLLSVGPEGIPRWQTQLFPGSGLGATITELQLDSEGFLLGTGYTVVSNSTYLQFAFKVEADNGNIVWANNYEVTEEIWKPVLLSEPVAGGNYLVAGHLTQNQATGRSDHQYQLQLDRTTGALVTSPSKYSLSNNLITEDAVPDRNGSSYYSIGSLNVGSNGNNGAVVSYISALTGNPQWSHLFRHPQGMPLSGKSLLEDNGLVVCAGQPTQIQALGSSSIYFWTFNKEQGTEVSREFILPESVIIYDLLRNGLGYLLFLEAPATNQVQLLQLDDGGNVLWSKRYSTNINKFASDNVWTADNFILVAAQQGRSPILLRLTAAGDPVGNCQEATDIPVEARELQLLNERLQLTQTDEGLQAAPFFAEPGSLQLSGESCLPDCPDEPGEDCPAPYTLAFTEGDAVDLGGFSAFVTADNQHFVGGQVNGRPYVAAIHPSGTILWEYELSELSDGGVVTDLIMDSQGYLAGTVKRLHNGLPDDRSGVFRIDPANGAVRWANLYGENLPVYFNNILERNNQYIITGSNAEVADLTNSSALLLTLDRATGTPLGSAIRYAPEMNQGFEDAEIDPATEMIYTFGNVGASGNQQIRVCAIRPDNTLAWVKDYTNTNVLNSFRGRDLLLGNGLLSIVGEKNDRNGANPGGLGYFQTDFDGTVTFSRRINVSFPVVPQALSWQGNDLLLMTYDQVGNRALMTTLDPLGFFPNSRIFEQRGTIDPSLETFRFNGTDLVSVGRKTPVDGPILEVLTAAGDQATNCLTEVSPSFQIFSQAAGIQGVPLDNIPPAAEPRISVTSAAWREANLFFLPDSSCPADCEVPDPPQPEICGNGVDDDDDGLTDCEDPDVAFSCCCLTPPTIALGPDTTICPGYQLTEGTNRRFSSYQWSTGATTDSLTITDAGTYWLMVTDSCGNTATDTVTLHLRPRPLLDLGADTTLCSNAVIPLLAQDGFAEYRWVDGSTEKSFTAFDAGTYWVIATDSCGNVATDTINVAIAPATIIDLGEDTTICLGDTLVFQLSGFDDYQWSQSSYLDCDNCPVVRFAPTEDTLLLVAARLNANCFSSDSIRVRVNIAAGTRINTTICAGDSLLFGDQLRGQSGQYLAPASNGNCRVTDTLDLLVLDTLATTATIELCSGDSTLIFGNFEQLAGTYQETFTAANGCDSTHRVEVVLLDTLASSETRTICAGDSVLIFGTFRQTAGTYAQVLTAANGCDSTHRVNLLLLDTVLTMATRTICTGDSTLIFGNFESRPGNYQQTFTGSNGCDSTHQVRLRVIELAATAIETRPACGGNAGAGEVLFNMQAGMLTIEWPDGTVGPTNNHLATGNYAITVTGPGGCTAVLDLSINGSELPDFSIVATPETCPGAADGHLVVTDLVGATYRLSDGTPQTSGTFSQLTPGDYPLTITDSLGCTETITVTISSAPPLLLDLPETLTLSLGDSVTLTPQTTLGTGRISWQSTRGDTCAACPTLTVRPATTTVITAVAEDENGCIATDQTTLIVREDELFYVPNAFSPNSDGVNDVLRIYPGPAVAEVLSLAVFDRWGNQAFLADNRNPAAVLAGWDGHSVNGKLAGLGVYVYMVEVRLFTGAVVRKAGEVLVVR